MNLNQLKYYATLKNFRDKFTKDTKSKERNKVYKQLTLEQIDELNKPKK